MSKYFTLAAKVLLSMLFFYVIMQMVNVRSSWEYLRKLTLGMFALCMALMLAQIVISVLRWKLVLDGLDEPTPFWKLFYIMYMSSFFNLVLPGTVGGDVIRIWHANKHGMHVSKAINSVFIERITTIFGLVLLVVTTQPLLVRRIGHVPGEWVFPSLLIIGCISIGMLLCFDKFPIGRLQYYKIVRGALSLALDARQIFLRPSYSLPLLLLALSGQIVFPLIIYALAVALGIRVTLVDAMVLVPPAILVMTLPISIAGWGARELVMVTTFGFIGILPEQALALSILFGLIVLLSALPGGIMWMIHGYRQKRKSI